MLLSSDAIVLFEFRANCPNMVAVYIRRIDICIGFFDGMTVEEKEGKVRPLQNLCIYNSCFNLFITFFFTQLPFQVFITTATSIFLFAVTRGCR